MKKALVLILLVALLLSTTTVLAEKPPKGPGGSGTYGQAGKSNTAHLYLVAKDPTTWEPIEDGPQGKMKYNLSGSTLEFVFNAKWMEPGVEYTLIKYTDPWPGSPVCLGTGTACEYGGVHIAGWVDPQEDWTGAKIWLVPSADVVCGSGMVAWNPSMYLFEWSLLDFDDTDVP